MRRLKRFGQAEGHFTKLVSSHDDRPLATADVASSSGDPSRREVHSQFRKSYGNRRCLKNRNLRAFTKLNLTFILFMSIILRYTYVLLKRNQRLRWPWWNEQSRNFRPGWRFWTRKICNSCVASL